MTTAGVENLKLDRTTRHLGKLAKVSACCWRVSQGQCVAAGKVGGEGRGTKTRKDKEQNDRRAEASTTRSKKRRGEEGEGEECARSDEPPPVDDKTRVSTQRTVRRRCRRPPTLGQLAKVYAL